MQDPTSGDLLLDEGQVQEAVSWAQQGLSAAVAGELPQGDPKRLLGSILARFDETIYKIYDNALKGAGQSEPARRSAIRMKDLARSVAMSELSDVGLRFSDAGMSARGWANVRYALADRGIRTMDDLSAAIAQNPVLAAQVAGASGGPGGVLSGPPTIYGSADTGYYLLGGGSGRGGAGRRSGSLWSGQFGRSLYSAYIAKRFWSWTAAPVFQEMGTYAEARGEIDPLGYYGRPGSLSFAGAAGMAGRAEALGLWSGQGAYETFGAFSDFGNVAMDTGTAGSRLWSAARIGGTTAILGGLLGSEAAMGMLGISAVSGAAPAAAILGGGVLGSQLALEGLNTVMPAIAPNYWKQDATLGSAFRTAGRLGYLVNYGARSLVGRGDEYLARSWERAPEFMSWLRGPISDPQVEAVREAAETLARDYNLPVGDAASFYAQMQRFQGAPISPGTDAYDITARMLAAARTEGVAPTTLGGEASAYAEALGAVPGTPGFLTAMDRYRGMSASERWLAMERFGRQAGMAGMLAPYLGSSRAAQSLVRRFGVETQTQAQVAQTLLASAAEYGADLGSPASYRLTPAGPTPVPLSEALVQFGGTLTPHQARLSADVGSRLMAAGVTPLRALQAAQNLGVTSSAAAGAFASYFDVSSQYDQVSPGMAEQLLRASQVPAPYQANLIAQIAQPMMAAGMANPLVSISDMGLTTPQLNLAGDMARGDLGAWSYASYHGGTLAGRFFNPSGQPITRTDFGSFVGMAYQQWLQYGNQSALMAMTGVDPNAAPTQQAAQFFGSSDMEAMRAWGAGGSYARTQLHRERMAGYQLAGAGIALQGVQLRREYLWGAGGSWDAPVPGSLWAMQDRARALQHQAQMASYSFSLERMDTAQSFARQRDAITRRRMDISAEYQLQSMDFSYQTALMQRDWARQDWEYQDKMGGLEFGWALQDINEAIRTSGGRQRRRLVQQRNRMATRYGLQRQHTEEQRGLQEELWAR
ncbi:MAG: hypothetical protein PVG14_14750, partial [Anaerolineales bacterium]